MSDATSQDGPQISDEDDDRFGTWYLIDLKTEEVVNTFHWTSCARRKREGLIEGWPEHTEDSLVIDGVPLAAEKRAVDIYERVSPDAR